MRRLYAFFVLVAVFFVLPGSAHAITIHDNFDTSGGDTYNVFGGWFVSGPISFQGEALQFSSAMRFTSPGNYFFDTADVAISLVEGTNAIDLRLAADDNGLPAAAIETFHLTGAMGPFGFDNPLLHVESASNPALESGTQYWLIASATGSTQAFWNSSFIEDVGGAQIEFPSIGFEMVPGEMTGAFRVTALADILKPIPEPTTMALVGLGVGVVATRAARRRFSRAA